MKSGFASPERPAPRARRAALATGIALLALVWCAAAFDQLQLREGRIANRRAKLELLAQMAAQQLDAEGCAVALPRLTELLRARGVSLEIGGTAAPDCAQAAGLPPAGAPEEGRAAFVGGRAWVVLRESDVTLLQEWRVSLVNTVLRNVLVTLLAAALFLALRRELRQQDRVQAELRATEQRWRAVFDTAPVGIVILPPNTPYLIANPAFQRMLGYSVEELQRLAPDDITHPDDVALTRQQVQRLVSGERSQVSFVKRYLHRDGRTVWVDIVISRLSTPGPLAGILVAVAEDVTGRRTAEDERQRLEAQLRQSQKLEALGTFAGGIAHDFNNILSAILGYGERAAGQLPPGPAQADLQQVLAAGARARSLVQRILAFSRSGMQASEVVDVNAVVAEAMDLVRAGLPPGVGLSLSSQAPGACVLGDSTRLHQVVMNLCSNAVQAVQGGGRVELAVAEVVHGAPVHVTSGELRAGRYVRIDVVDSGTGIAPEVQERMFDPFFTTRPAGEGTGLGLSLVDGIVKDHGGGIDVSSAPGQGSRFRIELPLAQGVAPAQPPDAGTVPQGRGETVLLVDDERALVPLGEDLLAELGYEAVGFDSPREALAAFARDPDRFDLLLADQTMPGLSGVALAMQLRDLRPGLPVLLMSGQAGPELEAQAAAAGVGAVLAKPLDRLGLARAVRTALDQG